MEATQTAGVVVHGDHPTFDVHSIRSHLTEDLTRALARPDLPLPPRPKYSLFANSYYKYATFVAADLNLEYRVAQLRSISQRRGGL